VFPNTPINPGLAPLTTPGSGNYEPLPPGIVPTPAQ
jgi:hypothetical protein